MQAWSEIIELINEESFGEAVVLYSIAADITIEEARDAICNLIFTFQIDEEENHG